ncbi:MAG: hypothetical protein LKI25_08495 [Atopobiaceae bacterium]|nr:hypothetical protein [Atopobiaceae bacterium]MCI2206867.1 hypothetical protein [Atopobiaceae bacterium]
MGGALVCAAALVGVVARGAGPSSQGASPVLSHDDVASVPSDVDQGDATPDLSAGDSAGMTRSGAETTFTDLARTTRWVETGDVEQVAAGLLRGYRDGDEVTTLVRAGYVDLLGRVWSCTVRGDGWVDTCVVQGSPASGAGAVTVSSASTEGAVSSKVSVMRFEEGRWADAWLEG